jgi:hypothetical protein
MKVLLIIVVVFLHRRMGNCWVSSWTPPLPPHQQQHQLPQHAYATSTPSITSTAILLSKMRLLPDSYRINVSLQCYAQQSYRLQRSRRLFMSLSYNSGSTDDTTRDDGSGNSSTNDDTPKDENNNDGIDLSFDPRLYKVRLSRATGIE